MMLAMAAFAVEDFFIKRVATEMSVGQMLLVLATGGAVIFAALCGRRGAALYSPDLLHPLVLTRNLAEVAATLCYISSLALIPLSLASSILQATPLLVTAGAAVWLGEHVGWRRWAAVAVGLAGVLVILRPGLEGFRPAALLAVLATAGLATRDLASRRVPRRIDSAQLAFWAYASLVPAAGALVMFGGGVAPASSTAWWALAAAVGVGAVAYGSLVIATRIGDVSVVIPFRYSRLIFALLLSVVLLGERPDALTLSGAAVVVGSGLYAWMRERRVAREAAMAKADQPAG
jgi:drug/metabolite transporter (DMT)-like permease